MSVEISKMIDYIKAYVNDEAIANIKRFNYFKYKNIIEIISNGLENSTYKNNIISYGDYEIIIYDNYDNYYYEITIIKNIDLYEPKGPSK